MLPTPCQMPPHLLGTARRTHQESSLCCLSLNTCLEWPSLHQHRLLWRMPGATATNMHCATVPQQSNNMPKRTTAGQANETQGRVLPGASTLTTSLCPCARRALRPFTSQQATYQRTCTCANLRHSQRGQQRGQPPASCLSLDTQHMPTPALSCCPASASLYTPHDPLCSLR